MANFSEKQIKIIKICIHQISNYGLQKLSMRQIAKESNLTQSSLYHHFESKDDIINAVLDFSIDQIEKFYTELDEISGSSMKKLKVYFERMCISYSENKDSFKIFMLGMVQFDPIHLEKFKEGMIIRRMNWLTGVIKSGQESGEIAAPMNTNFLALSIAGTLNSYLFHSLSIKDYYEKNPPEEIWNSIEKLLKI